MGNKLQPSDHGIMGGAAPGTAKPDPMEEAIALLEIELGPLEVPSEGDLTPEVRAHLDRMLEKIVYLNREIGEVQATAELRMADIQQWADKQNATRQRQIDYLRMVLEHAATTLQYRGGKKSVSLPHGGLGMRKQQPVLEILNEASALSFSKKKGIPYKHVETPYVGELKKWATEHDMIPAGCKLVERPDKPYIEVND